MRVFLIAGATAAFALSADAQNRPDDWSGVYKFTHKINFSSQPPAYDAENVLEIVPVSPTQAYVRADINANNGDICRFFAVARIEGDRLVYRGPMREFMSVKLNPMPPPQTVTTYFEDRCELTISRATDSAGTPVLRIGDRDHLCKGDICGARAYLDSETWPVSSRRQIRYMDRLKASPQYAEALRKAGLR